MKKKMIHVSLGVVIGFLLLAGVVWLFSKTLGDHETLYVGKPVVIWQQQLNGTDAGASNQAYAVVCNQIIPQLIDTMLHDTNEFRIRSAVVKALNGIPGIYIYFSDAEGRRGHAIAQLRDLGPAAKAAVPELIQMTKENDESLSEHAIEALGEIHSDPDVVIPLLISYLDNDSLNDEAATALGNYGSLAKSAIPKIIPLLHAADDDAQAAAADALKKIDPAAYVEATTTPTK